MYGVVGGDRCSVQGGWGVGVLGQMCEVIYGENRQEQQCEGTTTETERTTKKKNGWSIKALKLK